jgi:heavy metal translocating P-type ATPase
MRERALALFTLGGIVAGIVLWLAGEQSTAEIVWGASAVIVLVPLVVSTARTLRQGSVGVDAIALIAIATAVVLGEELAGAIVALMMAGGEALEAWAGRRARRDLQLLVERAPRDAHRYTGGALEKVAVETLVPGDLVLVRAGELVPADGEVASQEAVLDESALTGEPLPVTLERGERVRSGTANAGEAFDMRVTRPAAESAYAAIVRLVHAAQQDRAPFVRIADRYAAFFLPATLAMAGIAWAASGDPKRALAVLVVATPCPLILAAPIALVAGLSRAARRGIIVKGGSAIERLGDVRTVLLDKTGTLTLGQPGIERVIELALPADETLRLAASLDQLSVHAVAAGLVRDTVARGIALQTPSDVREAPGRGIAGTVDGHAVTVGSSGWLETHGYADARIHAQAVDGAHSGRAKVLVGVDGQLAGVIVMGDDLRPGAVGIGDELRDLGVEHVALVTGDRAEIASEVAQLAGIEEVYAERSPEEKVALVEESRARPELRSIMMVGDGINDAPALALADVGVAMAGMGATISSETADVVITVEHADRVVEALRIGRRSLGIARQSVVYGLGLSIAAMFVAALGYLPPVWGALFQEVIDVAVILNALRALRG